MPTKYHLHRNGHLLQRLDFEQVKISKWDAVLPKKHLTRGYQIPCMGCRIPVGLVRKLFFSISDAVPSVASQLKLELRTNAECQRSLSLVFTAKA